MTDVSTSSEEHNVVMETLSVTSKICRRTVGTVFQSYLQDTQSGDYKVHFF